MKIGPLLFTSMLGLIVVQSNLPAQSEGGNSAPSGGTTGISGSGQAGGAADHGVGGKDVKGDSGPATPIAPETNAPEFHPPPTSASQ